jgi:hypothetical protein
MTSSKNIGQVVGLYIGTSAPSNTAIIWYDNTPNQMCHKVYDTATDSWCVLNPQIISNTTYSEISESANKNGLSVGKSYIITDKYNTLATAITSTKIQYVDNLGNIIIDDLGTNKQYHVGSGNIMIDDISGVVNALGNTIFSFTEDTPNVTTDYLLGKAKRNGKWVLSKFSFSSLLSSNSNNSLSWSNGIFFNFKNSLNSLLNKIGGIVGYDLYKQKVDDIDTSINDILDDNKRVVSNVNKTMDEKTADAVIYEKKISKDVDISVAAGDILKGDTLYTIVSKFQRYINKFKYANGIRLSSSFSASKKYEYINNNDTVESALGKVQYVLGDTTNVVTLPNDWTWSSTDSKYSNIYEQYGLPKAGDTLYNAFGKITAYITNIKDYFTISDDWESSDSSEDIVLSMSRNTIDESMAKIVGKFNQIGSIKKGYIKFPHEYFNASTNSSYNSEFSSGYVGNSRMILYDYYDDEETDVYYIRVSPLDISMGSVQDNDKSLDVNTHSFKFLSTGTSNNVVSPSGISLGRNDVKAAFFAEHGVALSAKSADSYDAFFKNILLHNITIQPNVVVGGTDYYITDSSFYVISSANDYETHVYLPQMPEQGKFVYVTFTDVDNSTASCFVNSQGNDYISNYGSYVKELNLSRHRLYVFFSMYTFNDVDDNTSMLWGMLNL